MNDTEKLIQLQKLIDDISDEQERISIELADLRSQGKEKTVQFKQQFTKKMMNVNIISLLQSYELM